MACPGQGGGGENDAADGGESERADREAWLIEVFRAHNAAHFDSRLAEPEILVELPRAAWLRRATSVRIDH